MKIEIKEPHSPLWYAISDEEIVREIEQQHCEGAGEGFLKYLKTQLKEGKEVKIDQCVYRKAPKA